MYSRPLLCVLALLVVLSAGAPRAAQAQTTALFIDSQAGDPVGAGQVTTFTPVDGTFSAQTSSTYGATISVVLNGDSHSRWNLVFAAGGANAVPAAGVYESARRAASANFVGLDISGTSSCGAITGRFVVLEAVYSSNGSVTRFAADFEQHCRDADAALFGAVRYNSTVSTLVPFAGAFPIRRLTVTPPANGSIQGSGLDCGSSGVQCAVTMPGPADAAIRAVPDPGFLFAGWAGDCSGGPRLTVRITMAKTCSAAFTPLVPASPRTLAVITGMTNAVTRGTPVVVSATNSVWSMSSYGSGFQLQVRFTTVTDQSYVWFIITPPTGQTFEIGREYSAAMSSDATHAGLWGASDGGSCSTAGGTFVVRDWSVGSNGVPTRFSIDFRQACGGSLYGTLQYASSYAGYGRLDVANTALQFTAVRDLFGVVSHSADQIFYVSPAGPSTYPWDVKSDQSWLTATPASGTASAAVTARVKIGASLSNANPAIARLQVLAGGILNVPDPVTVTLVVVPTDMTVRPFALFRPASGAWFMPGQGPLQFGRPGDVPLSGDFDGDGTPDIAIYRPSTGEWFAPGQPARQWGWPGDIPVPADYNGDGITDIAVFRQSGLSAEWFVFGDPAPPRAWGARGDVPVPGDYDGDGLADLAVFRPATGTWRVLWSSTGQAAIGTLGQAGDIPLVADFDKDRRIDVAVFRPSTGTWYVTLSACSSCTPFTYSRQFGLPGDIPVPLDVTGDGWAELRVWRPSTGMWYSYDRFTSQSSSQQYGLPGDVPVMARPMLAGVRPADLDGDRRADVTVFRPSTGEWFTRHSSTGYAAQQWGLDGDIPVPGDYDGVRRAHPAVYRPSTGEWFVRRFDGTVLYRVWGLPGDVPVPADYDGDSRIDMAVYRPSSGEWLILTSASDYGAVLTVAWGLPGDRPAPADFDGDGRADPAVYRPSTGEWFVARSSGGWYARQWGLSGDVPMARDFDGDGRADFAVFRPATGEWFVLDPIAGTLILTRQWGLNGDVPAADDYDGDGAADLAVYRPATSEWFVLPSSGAPSFVLQWGLGSDVPVTRR